MLYGFNFRCVYRKQFMEELVEKSTLLSYRGKKPHCYIEPGEEDI